MWFVSGALLIVWFILKFVLHKGGFIHVLLITSISLFVIELLGYRNKRYHRTSSAGSASDKL
jgi:hypothetical protein